MAGDAHPAFPLSLPTLASIVSAAEWESRSAQAGVGESSQQREVGVGEVKRLNRMMVVYGFVLQGARLRV